MGHTCDSHFGAEKSACRTMNMEPDHLERTNQEDRGLEWKKKKEKKRKEKQYFQHFITLFFISLLLMERGISSFDFPRYPIFPNLVMQTETVGNNWLNSKTQLAQLVSARPSVRQVPTEFDPQ